MSPQVVLITGALTGIARATALAFAHNRREDRCFWPPRRGWSRRSPPNCAGRRRGSRVRPKADVRHEEEVRALVDRTVERFGRLDIAVNAAGTEGKPGPRVGTDCRDLRRDLQHERARDDP